MSSRSVRWRRVRDSAGILLAASVVPLPVRGRPPTPFGGDKLLHATAHVWLTRSLAAALDAEGVSPPVAAGVAVAVSSGYGVGIERLQEHVPGRRYERGDVRASVVGSAVGSLLWFLVDREPVSVDTVPAP